MRTTKARLITIDVLSPLFDSKLIILLLNYLQHIDYIICTYYHFNSSIRFYQTTEQIKWNIFFILILNTYLIHNIKLKHLCV